MEVYSDKLLEISHKHASLTWGFGSFTNQTPRVICELTQANEELTATGWLTAVGKEVIQKRLHSKILAFQILAMLSDDARKMIECQSEEYTRKDMSGFDEEMDGMTITALTLWRLQPHHKVDMYSKISAVEKMTLAEYDNDINLFFDSIKSVKLKLTARILWHIQTTHLFAIFLFNSRTNFFLTTLSLSLFLSWDLGIWTKKL